MFFWGVVRVCGSVSVRTNTLVKHHATTRPKRGRTRLARRAARDPVGGDGHGGVSCFFAFVLFFGGIFFVGGL